MVDRSQSLVLVTLLGTRIFPNPSIYDVVMDLRAETVPFLDGEAHAGMVVGMKNILDKSFSVLRESVNENPGYSILIVGYSLGNPPYFKDVLRAFLLRSGSGPAFCRPVTVQ